ncbi:glycosyltransferase [Photobacterium damselae]|uniref:glycosyltransferase n=1 Tax=Photobacterium damselae TaxID=38293 RepID=UPI004068F54B
MKIEFLISTYGTRINNLRLEQLPKKKNVSYLIIVQQYDFDKFNHHLLRDDIRILKLSSIGVTKSRNYAIKNANKDSDILIFMDDDVVFVDDDFDSITELYRDDKVKFATHQIINEDNQLRKKYINNNTKHNLFSILKYGTVEISVRHEFIKKNNLKFNENFGAGAELSACDEPIFLSDIIKSKGIGYHINKNLFIHPNESNGQFNLSKNSVMSRGAMFRVIYGDFLSIPLIVIFYMKQIIKIRRVNFNIFVNLIKGYLYV